MSSQPICKQCGQPIWGEYLSAPGATWHPAHFLCAACHRPIDTASFNIHEGRAYHPACYLQQAAPRCAYCNAPLTGEYLVDAWGTKFCKRHKNEYLTCSFCGRLIPPEQQERGVQNIDSVRCPICRASAIETILQAQPIFARLKQWVSSQRLTYNNLPLTLELCNRARLAQYMHTRGEPHALGVTMSTAHTLNGQDLRTEVNGIAILHGLPSTLFQGVTIHELGHVWLIAHGIKGLPTWAEEGFCDLLSYRYYIQLDTPESCYHAASIERNPHPIYGDGFRRVRTIADRVGFERLVETLLRAKQLPSL